jgi:hypothetical protein
MGGSTLRKGFLRTDETGFCRATACCLKIVSTGNENRLPIRNGTDHTGVSGDGLALVPQGKAVPYPYRSELRPINENHFLLPGMFQVCTLTPSQGVAG